MSSASRGLAPREGLEACVVGDGPCWALFCAPPQAAGRHDRGVPGPVRPIFINTRLKTLARGQASRGGRHGASSGTASSGWLARRQRDQGGVPREVPVTQAMTTQGARRAPACAASSIPLWCKGSKRSRGVPRHQAKVAISVQQDQDQEDYETEVTVEPKTASSLELCAGEDYFCQDS